MLCVGITLTHITSYLSMLQSEQLISRFNAEVMLQPQSSLLLLVNR